MASITKTDSKGPADQKISGADTKGYPEENPGKQPKDAGVEKKKEDGSKGGEDENDHGNKSPYPAPKT
jgi:hypothetical protein